MNRLTKMGLALIGICVGTAITSAAEKDSNQLIKIAVSENAKSCAGLFPLQYHVESVYTFLEPKGKASWVDSQIARTEKMLVAATRLGGESTFKAKSEVAQSFMVVTENSIALNLVTGEAYKFDFTTLERNSPAHSFMLGTLGGSDVLFAGPFGVNSRSLSELVKSQPDLTQWEAEEQAPTKAIILRRYIRSSRQLMTELTIQPDRGYLITRQEQFDAGKKVQDLNILPLPIDRGSKWFISEIEQTDYSSASGKATRKISTMLSTVSHPDAAELDFSLKSLHYKPETRVREFIGTRDMKDYIWHEEQLVPAIGGGNPDKVNPDSQTNLPPR